MQLFDTDRDPHTVPIPPLTGAGPVVNFQVKSLAIRQYQDRIDSRATEDQAIAVILAAVRLCDFAAESDPERDSRSPVGG